MAFVWAAVSVERGLQEISYAAAKEAVAIDQITDCVFSPPNHSVVGPPSPPVGFDSAEEGSGCDRRGALGTAPNDNTTLANLVGVCIDLGVIRKRPADAPDS